MVTDAMAVRFYTFFFEHPSSGCIFSIPGQVPPVKGIFCIAVICFLYGSHFRVGGRAVVLIFLIEVRAGALVQIKAQAVPFRRTGAFSGALKAGVSAVLFFFSSIVLILRVKGHFTGRIRLCLAGKVIQ